MVKLTDSKTLTVKVNAKVNLALDIKGVTDNGYHIIDTVMTDIGIYDEITVAPRQDNAVNIVYKNGEFFKDDTAAVIGNLIVEKYGVCGADITIKKNIPLSSGLGGSSADAAGVARAMERLYGIKVDASLLKETGSDVPFMYYGGAARVRGTGEIIEKIQIPSLYFALLVDNRVKINTKSVYCMYDILGGEHIDIDTFLQDFDNPVNSLEKAASALEPSIQELKRLLKNSGFPNTVMTGSGGGVIGYTRDLDDYVGYFQKLKSSLSGLNGIKLYTFKTELL